MRAGAFATLHQEITIVEIIQASGRSLQAAVVRVQVTIRPTTPITTIWHLTAKIPNMLAAHSNYGL